MANFFGPPCCLTWEIERDAVYKNRALCDPPRHSVSRKSTHVLLRRVRSLHWFSFLCDHVYDLDTVYCTVQHTWRMRYIILISYTHIKVYLQ